MPEKQKNTKKIIVGNWKTAPGSPDEAITIYSEISERLTPKIIKNTEIILCPPFSYLAYFSKKGGSNKQVSKIKRGAQNVYAGEKAMCTGEVNASMLKHMDISHVIVGHSERRKWESNEDVNKKVLALLEANMTPIVCIGEEKRDEEGNYLQEIAHQLLAKLARVPKQNLDSIIIAYEPIWAIGAASAMNAEDIHQMTIFIRKTLVDHYKIKAPSLPILYGGSVDPTNAHGILTQGQVQGLLIGRQSLIPENFLEIISLV